MGLRKLLSFDKHDKWVKKMQSRFQSQEAGGFSCSNCQAACTPNNWLYHAIEPNRGVLCFYTENKRTTQEDTFKCSISQNPSIKYTMQIGRKVKVLSGVGVKVWYDEGISKSWIAAEDMRDGPDDGILEDMVQQDVSADEETEILSDNGDCIMEKKCVAPVGLSHINIPPDVSTGNETFTPQDGLTSTSEITEDQTDQDNSYQIDKDSDYSSDGYDETDFSFFEKKYYLPSDDEEKRYLCVNCIIKAGTKKVQNEVSNICTAWEIEVSKKKW